MAAPTRGLDDFARQPHGGDRGGRGDQRLRGLGRKSDRLTLFGRCLGGAAVVDGSPRKAAPAIRTKTTAVPISTKDRLGRRVVSEDMRNSWERIGARQGGRAGRNGSTAAERNAGLLSDYRSDDRRGRNGPR